MANAAGDDLARDLGRFTKDPSDTRPLLRALGRVLWARPSPEALAALLADIDACRHRLDAEPDDESNRELRTRLVAATAVLAAYLDAARAHRVPDAVKRQVLHLVAERDGVTPSEVADELARPRPQVNRILLDLAEHGWVSGDRDPADGKVRIYRTTAEGRSQVGQLTTAT